MGLRRPPLPPGFVDQGDSVMLIEHNHDVIKTTDWIVDFGP